MIQDLSERRIKHLFRALSQVYDSSKLVGIDGTGLALVVSKRLASLLDGDIEVLKEKGARSHCDFRLARCLVSTASNRKCGICNQGPLQLAVSPRSVIGGMMMPIIALTAGVTADAVKYFDSRKCCDFGPKGHAIAWPGPTAQEVFSSTNMLMAPNSAPRLQDIRIFRADRMSRNPYRLACVVASDFRIGLKKLLKTE